LAAQGLLNHLIEPLPDNLEVVSELKAPALNSDNSQGKELSSCSLLLSFGQACFPSHLSLTLIYPAVGVMPFVREEKQLTQKKPGRCATNYSGKIRRVADYPVGEHILNLLAVILGLLLMR
jgi:hypothetical protein